MRPVLGAFPVSSEIAEVPVNESKTLGVRGIFFSEGELNWAEPGRFSFHCPLYRMILELPNDLSAHAKDEGSAIKGSTHLTWLGREHQVFILDRKRDMDSPD
jgi:hypothetical protein